MIFTYEQWSEIYRKHRGDREGTTRPDEVIIGILEHDALEHGIHQTWIDFWNDPHCDFPNQRWANTLYVMLEYPAHDFGGQAWKKAKK